MWKSNRGMRFVPLYEAGPNRRAPEPSLEPKRRSRLELTAQSMTRGPRPACQGGRVTNKGVKRRDLNCRPHVKRGRS